MVMRMTFGRGAGRSQNQAAATAIEIATAANAMRRAPIRLKPDPTYLSDPTDLLKPDPTDRPADVAWDPALAGLLGFRRFVTFAAPLCGPGRVPDLRARGSPAAPL